MNQSWPSVSNSEDFFKHCLIRRIRITKTMKTKTKITAYIVHSIAAAVLLLTAQISLAGSATWLLSPQDSAWENLNNWTLGGPPNGPSDIATFAQSSQTAVNISTSEEVNSIVFTSNSASFTLYIPPYGSSGGALIISGTGVSTIAAFSRRSKLVIQAR